MSGVPTDVSKQVVVRATFLPDGSIVRDDVSSPAEAEWKGSLEGIPSKRDMPVGGAVKVPINKAVSVP
jgi:hypothetical protein